MIEFNECKLLCQVDIIVIGGGAAGFFTAINIADKHPEWNVIILEKSSKLLQKVRVSGGGRCNVTNFLSKPNDLTAFYPRGNKKLYPVFKQFSTTDMRDWLSDRGISTAVENDGRIFPQNNSSQTIIDCFLKEAERLNIHVFTNHGLQKLEQIDSHWQVDTEAKRFTADKVVVATGSSQAVWDVLYKIGLSIEPPVPSLFTFNIKDERIQDLQGISFDTVEVKITNSKLAEAGPLLITHWGVSGPAILKLSAWGAIELRQNNYHFEILINFIGQTQDQAKLNFHQFKQNHPKRKVINYSPFNLPKRFWEKIVTVAGISDETIYGELSKKETNKLIEELTQGRYKVNGKSTFKEEFVMAGGVNLKEVNLATFECKSHPNLYLAGEVLNIDGLTGGFNFQACWSAGWIISENI